MEDLLPTRIDELLAKYLAQEATPVERTEVETWMAESPANQAYYDSLVQVWDETAHTDPADLAAIDAGWASLQQRIGQVDSRPATVFSMRRPMWRVAAAVIALLVIGISLWRLLPRESIDSEPLFAIYTAIDSAQTVTLVDGSSIRLNMGSKLTVPHAFSATQRALSLEGTAFFEVASDAAHPFLIETELGTVRVLGTQFEVIVDSLQLDVKVAQGVVEVAIPDISVLQLTALQQVRYRVADSAPPAVETMDANALSPYTLSFVFEDQPLSAVVATLQAAYGVEIMLGSPRIQDCLVNSPFEQASLEYILEVLAGTHSLSWEKQDSAYVLSGTGCAR